MIDEQGSTWMRWVLRLAAAYNLAWGALAILFPHLLFDWAGMARPNYPELWQCIGMIVGVYGIAYGIASTDPVRHWPVVLAGLLGKVFGPIGFAMAVANGRMPLRFGATIITNDLVWWVPFGLILLAAYRNSLGRRRIVSPEIQRMALRARTQHGVSLDELTRLSPTLLVFLRHAGCTFCREALADLAAKRAAIEANGARLALVHMGSEEQARPFLRRYGLEDISRVSDPKQSIYRAFGLHRGSFRELFGPKVWWRGFQAGVLNRHGVGRLVGDGFQMPGVFLLYHGEVIRSYRHQSAADRPDYLLLSTPEGLPSPQRVRK
ncbi:MAG: AhpC/TSA family protein [Bryobacter sp.]|jgi:peroxiredoxin|nr:AhpC/TSA family protein [Bryobacter sp.]